jgi:hypothetical protein
MIIVNKKKQNNYSFRIIAFCFSGTGMGDVSLATNRTLSMQVARVGIGCKSLPFVVVYVNFYNPLYWDNICGLFHQLDKCRPPSTGNKVPVVKELYADEDKNTTARATSSTVPFLPIGDTLARKAA